MFLDQGCYRGRPPTLDRVEVGVGIGMTALTRKSSRLPESRSTCSGSVGDYNAKLRKSRPRVRFKLGERGQRSQRCPVGDQVRQAVSGPPGSEALRSSAFRAVGGTKRLVEDLLRVCQPIPPMRGQAQVFSSGRSTCCLNRSSQSLGQTPGFLGESPGIRPSDFEVFGCQLSHQPLKNRHQHDVRCPIGYQCRPQCHRGGSVSEGTSGRLCRRRSVRCITFVAPTCGVPSLSSMACRGSR